MNFRILFSLFIFIFYSHAYASEWSKIAGGKTKLEGLYVAEYVDISSIKKINQLVQFWRKTVLMDKNEEPIKGNDILTSAFRHELFYTNCTEGQTGLKQVIVENNNNYETYRKLNDPIDFKIEKPGSSIEHAASLACHISSGMKIPTEKTEWLDFRIDHSNGFMTLQIAKNTVTRSQNYTKAWIRSGSLSRYAYYIFDCNAEKYKKIGTSINLKDMTWVDIELNDTLSEYIDMLPSASLKNFLCVN